MRFNSRRWKSLLRTPDRLNPDSVYNSVMSGFSTIQAAVDAIARGEVIIVVDAEDRENEGDFICAAEKATTETINFMLGGRGQFCTPLSARDRPPLAA